MHFTHQPLYIVPNQYKDPLYEPARQYKQNCDQISHMADRGDTEFRDSGGPNSENVKVITPQVSTHNYVRV